MSLPAQARQRWKLDGGGAVGYLDLGDVVLLVPGGIKSARRALIDQVTAHDWAAAGEGFGDADLANE